MNKPDIVFNDISLSYAPTASIGAACDAFENFLSSVATLIDEAITNPIIRSQISLQDVAIPVADGTTWTAYDWIGDATTEKELRDFLLTLDSKIPVEQGVVLAPEDESELLDCSYNAGNVTGPDCFAIGFALYTGDIVVSLALDPIWDAYELTAFVCKDGTVLRSVKVTHVSNEAHCATIADVLHNRLYTSIKTANDFVASKTLLFPNLCFSPDIDEQVDKLQNIYLINAIAKLGKMDRTAADWAVAKKLTPDYQFQWSGESSPTMDKYSAERTFRMPSGDIAVFEKHLYFSNRHRIHFIEDRAAMNFIIGYIGDHLPTIKYPH